MNDQLQLLQQLSGKLQKVDSFQQLSSQSALADDDAARTALNISLQRSFIEMEQSVGASSSLVLHTIRTKEEAMKACQYYAAAKNELMKSIQKASEEMDAGAGAGAIGMFA
jgi:DNA repair exonuclease SbcCD ATPase subunit